ncbi:hypothetical protein Cgig2_028734 [Carnegiea gigantea]|uniref:H15 domain-containing protein n=1 Tax=Carnegiea gigantea TaxID=171969 RepID=A0A9Q1GIL5_9CARY|nr:hypothetical protein Cgig2_028734 [Carnegiea gigantea]
MAATEEPIVATEVADAPAADAAPAEEKPAAEENPGGDNPSSIEAKPKKAKAKKPSAPRKSRNPPTHPPYFEMIKEAITTLKERNGSSQYAIQKFIEEKHKQLPPNFRKLLLANLKKFVTSGKLVKVKGSYKLPPSRLPAPKAEPAPTKKSKPAAAAKAKPKAAAAKSKAAAAKPKAAAAKPKAIAAKPKAATAKPKAAAAAAKPKAKAAAAAKPKGATKSKAKPAAKPKEAAAPAKTRSAGTKRKALSDVKSKEKPAKVAKTTAKSTPSKKAAPAAKAAPKKAAPAKKASVKSLKPKSVKSPAKRAMPKRGKKRMWRTEEEILKNIQLNYASRIIEFAFMGYGFGIVAPYHRKRNQVVAVVYLVDACGKQRFADSKKELDALLSDDAPARVQFLILGDKIDIPYTALEEELYYHRSSSNSYMDKGRLQGTAS